MNFTALQSSFAADNLAGKDMLLGFAVHAFDSGTIPGGRVTVKITNAGMGRRPKSPSACAGTVGFMPAG